MTKDELIERLRDELATAIGFMRSCNCHTVWKDTACECCGSLPEFEEEYEASIEQMEQALALTADDDE